MLQALRFWKHLKFFWCRLFQQLFTKSKVVLSDNDINYAKVGVEIETLREDAQQYGGHPKRYSYQELWYRNH